MFSFFKFKKDSSILGIDIGAYAVKAVEAAFQKEKNILQVNKFALEPLEEGIIRFSIIQEKSIIGKIQKLVNKLGTKSNKVSLSLPAEVSLWGTLALNLEEEITKENFLNFIENDIPFKIDQIVYSYQIISTPGESSAFKFFYVAALKKLVEEIISIFNNLGFEVVNIEPSFTSLNNFLQYLVGEKKRLVIDWGYEKMTFYFFDENFLIYCRTFYNFGLKNFYKKVQRELQVLPDLMVNLFEDIEKMKGEGLKEKFSEISQVFEEEILLEIDRTKEYVETKYSFIPEETFFIGGGVRFFPIFPRLKSLTENSNFSQFFDQLKNKIEIKNLSEFLSGLPVFFLSLSNAWGGCLKLYDFKI